MRISNGIAGGIVSAALCLVLMASSSLGADWPMINGDAGNTRDAPTETAISADTAQNLTPTFTLQAAGDVWTTPTVVDGALYFVDGGGVLTKADAKTGAIIWTHQISDYDGVAKAVSRGTPAYADGMLVLGDRSGAHLIGIDAATGEKKWITQVDAYPSAIITSSPIIGGDQAFVGVSSSDGSKIIADPTFKSTFRGSLASVDIHTGKLLWKTFTMPDNGGQPDGWSGGAVISVAAADAGAGIVYFSTDHEYTQPASVMACLDAAHNDWKDSCYPAAARFDSVVAVDMKSGTPKWTFRGFGNDVYELACGVLPSPAAPFSTTPSGSPAPVRYCPPEADYLNWAFAAGSPQLYKATVDGKHRDLVAIAQKSGILWSLDAETGAVVWHTQIGPYSEPGGLTWGTAYDGKHLFVTLTNLDHTPYALVAGVDKGTAVTGGVWSALEPATGALVWQTADPQNASDYAAPAVANGVVFAGSMAKTGSQMYAMNADSGQIIWQFAAGASIASHPAVADGIVYWGSGFSLFGGVSGKTLYAFGLPR